MSGTIRATGWLAVLLACSSAAQPPAAGPPAAPAPPKQQLYVLPAAFSPESHRNYAAWIEKLTADGYGNAIWQEIEEVFFDHPRYVVLQSPVTHDEFQKILAARQAAVSGTAEKRDEPRYALPDKVVTVNTNFFTRPEAKLAWGKANQREQFHVTVYLRHYDLAGGKLNIAVPAQADAVDANPVLAARQATRAAVARLLARLERGERDRAPPGPANPGQRDR